MNKATDYQFIQMNTARAQADIDALRTAHKLRRKPRPMAWKPLIEYADIILKWANAQGSSKYLVAELAREKLGINVSPHIIYRFVKALNGGQWTHPRTKN